MEKEGGGGGDGKHAIHLYVRSEVLEMDAVPLPLLAYCSYQINV